MDTNEQIELAPGVYESTDGTRRRVMWAGQLHECSDDCDKSEYAVKYVPIPNPNFVFSKQVLRKAFLKWAVHYDENGEQFVKMIPDYV